MDVSLESAGVPPSAVVVDLSCSTFLDHDVLHQLWIEHGIYEKHPQGGQVSEQIDYPPHHSVVEVLDHGSRHPFPSVLRLQAADPRADVANSELRIDVEWIDLSRLPEHWEMLAQGFLAARARETRSAVTWANMALERRVYEVVSASLRPHANERRLEDFLGGDAATYAWQLDPLLAIATSLHDTPPPDAQRLGLMQRLRRLRNDVVHSRAARPKQSEVVSLLVDAAVFLHYLEMLADDWKLSQS